MRKFTIVILLVTTMIMFNGCFYRSTGYAWIDDNEDIDADIRTQIENIDKDIIGYMCSNDKDGIINLLEDKTLVNTDEFNAAINHYFEVIDESLPYHYLGQHYFKKDYSPNPVTLMDIAKDEGYTVATSVGNDEVFISLILFEYENGQSLLTIEHIRDKEDWKIRSVFLGDYSYYGMTALDYYERAKTCHDEGRLLSAALMMYGSRTMISPSTLMHYIIEDEIYELVNTLETEFTENNPFPIEFDDLPGVVIYAVDLKIVRDGLMPDFMYKTDLDVTDGSSENEQALNDEAYIIHKKMMDLYPGMDGDFAAFLYGAASYVPGQEGIPYDRFGTVITMDEN